MLVYLKNLLPNCKNKGSGDSFVSHGSSNRYLSALRFQQYDKNHIYIMVYFYIIGDNT